MKRNIAECKDRQVEKKRKALKKKVKIKIYPKNISPNGMLQIDKKPFNNLFEISIYYQTFALWRDTCTLWRRHTSRHIKAKLQHF